MKPRMKKTLKRAAIITTGVFAFVGTFLGGYMVTPNRTKYIDVSVDTPAPTAFGQFVEKITRDVGLGEDHSANNYLSASFDNLVLKYKMNEDSQFVNTIAVDGGVDFRMSDLSLSGIEFSIDAEADYNGKKLPLTLGRFRKDVYFGLKDMKMKFTDFSTENLIYQYWYAFARYAHLDFPKLMENLGTLLTDKIGGLIDGLMNPPEDTTKNKGMEDATGGLDVMSLISNPKEELIDGHWHITLGEDGGDMQIELITNEEFTLERVNLGTISVGNLEVSGAVNIDLKNYDEFTSPAAGNDYVEVFNYTGLTHNIAKLLMEDGQHQKAGFEFSLDLDNNDYDSVNKVTNRIDIAKINGSLNVDFDKLLDLSQYTLDENGSSRVDEETNNEPEEERTISDIINDVGFNFQLNLLGQQDIEYANLDLSFAEGEGYVRFNEQEDANHNKKAVMKLKVDTPTMNRLVDMIPDMMDQASGEEQGSSSLDTLTSFLTDDLAECVEKGDFSFVLDMLETLENDQDGIHLGLNLSQLGIGENARVDINVKNDARYPNFNDVYNDENLSEDQKEEIFSNVETLDNLSKFEISAENITFGDYVANVNAKTSKFADVELGSRNDYQSVKFIPDIIDQISDFTNTKKTGFVLNGSMKDSAGLGMTFTGKGQLDNNDTVKEGYGNLEIKQYKYRPNTVWATHKIALNVTNLASNVEQFYNDKGELISQSNNNLARFVYGDPTGSKNIKGKMRLQTFSDILDIIKTFANDFGSDPKFTKFLSPILDLLGLGVVGDIIDSKDYVHLASNQLLKEISVINNGKTIRIVISKELLNFPSDITLDVGLKGDYDSDNQGLSSLDIVNFNLGNGDSAKTINMHFELTDYDTSFVDVVDKNPNTKYMDLDSVKVLVDLGINTSKPNYWHLGADANVNALLGALNIDLKNINFYIFVDGEKAKVYGKFGSIPTSSLYTQDYGLLKTGHSMSSEMSFESYNDEEHNGVSGEFNIHRTLDETSTTLQNWSLKTKHTYQEYHYRSDGKHFLDDIARYLLGGVIGINNSYISKLGGDNASTSTTEREAGDFTNTFTDTGLSYTTRGSGDSLEHVFNVGLNLDELTGISVLHELEAEITSKRYQYLNTNQKIDVLNKLTATLKVLLDVKVTFTATVKNVEFAPSAALAAWNTNGQANLERLSGEINGVTIGTNSQYYNNFDKPYKYTWEKIG